MPRCVPTHSSDPRPNLANQLFVVGVQPADVETFLVEAQHVRAGNPVTRGGKSQSAQVLDDPSSMKSRGTHHPLQIDHVQIKMAVALDHKNMRQVIILVDETCVVESSGKRREGGNQCAAVATIMRSPEHIGGLSAANLGSHYKAADGAGPRRRFSSSDRRSRAKTTRAHRV